MNKSNVEDGENQRLLGISDLIDMLGISARTIRYYEELGFIHPYRTAGNHRIYHRKDYARLRMILRGRMLGFSLDEMKELFQLYDADPSEKEQLKRGIELAKKHLEDIHSRMSEMRILETDLTAALEDAQKRLKQLQVE